jgi:hypothetical protein
MDWAPPTLRARAIVAQVFCTASTGAVLYTLYELCSQELSTPHPGQNLINAISRLLFEAPSLKVLIMCPERAPFRQPKLRRFMGRLLEMGPGKCI